MIETAIETAHFRIRDCGEPCPDKSGKPRRFRIVTRTKSGAAWKPLRKLATMAAFQDFIEEIGEAIMARRDHDGI